MKTLRPVGYVGKVVAAALSLVLLTAPIAHANLVYSGNSSELYQSGNDGSDPAIWEETNGPAKRQVAANSSYIYWTKSGVASAATIGRIKVDGTGEEPNFIPGPASGSRLGVAVNTDYIYWINASGSIGRANIDGTGVDDAFVTVATGANNIALSDSHIYWTDGGGVSRVQLDGQNLEEDIVAASGAFGIVTDANYLYWSNFANGSGTTIGRAGLDGSASNPNFITGLSGPSGLNISSGYIHWGNFGTRTVGRAAIDGTGANAAWLALPNSIEVFGIAQATLGRTVTFDSNGGAGTMASQFSPAAADLNANTFTAPTGKVFKEWNTDPNGSGTAYANEAQFPFSANTMLYAQWEIAKTVTFNANGGAGTMSDQLAAEPTKLKPNEFTRSGHRFKEWNTAADGSGTTYANEAEFPFAADATLYAQWIKDGGGDKPAQSASNACVTPPTRLPRTGRAPLMKSGCVTNADQRIAVKIVGKPRARGDMPSALASARIACLRGGTIRPANNAGARYGAGYKYCARGVTVLITRNTNRLRLSWFAPETTGYSEFRQTQTYRR